MIIADLHVKYHAVKAFLVYPGDSYLNIDGAEIISAAALFRGILGERKFSSGWQPSYLK